MNKVLKGAGVLAVCSLIAKIIGALYRIPLTNIVGAEGIGLYQMVFPLYTVLLTISSGGLPVAISKVVSSKIAKNDEAGARQVLKISLITLSVLGLIASAITVLLKDKIAFIQGNPKAALPYLGIAPSIFFVAVISCFRGYYQGKQNMLPSAISQIIEQVIKLSAGLAFAKILIKYSLEMAVFGALLGVTLSEIIAMAVLLIQFFFTNLRYKKRSKVNALTLNFETAADIAVAGNYRRRRNAEYLKEIYKVAIPVTLGSLVMPVTQVIDSILVINLLVSLGYMKEEATSLFGLVTGPINSIINMPIVITLSIAVALLPKVAECFNKKECASAQVGQALKFSFIIGLLAMLALSFFAHPVMSTLYSRGLSAEHIKLGSVLLALGSISVLYVSILQVATSVLQGSNLAHKPALNLLYGAVFKVIFTLILLPVIGITGAMAGTVICYGVTCFLDINSMRKVCPLKLNVREFIVSPLLSGGAFAGVSLLSKWALGLFLPNTVTLGLSMLLSLISFCVVLLLTGAIKKEELKDLNIVKKLLKKRKKKAV